jgi:hypothetical protein
MTLDEIKQLSNSDLLYLYDDIVKANNSLSDKMQKLWDNGIWINAVAEIIIERMGGEK